MIWKFIFCYHGGNPLKWGGQIHAASADNENSLAGIRDGIWIEKIPSILLDKRHEWKVFRLPVYYADL